MACGRFLARKSRLRAEGRSAGGARAAEALPGGHAQAVSGNPQVGQHLPMTFSGQGRVDVIERVRKLSHRPEDVLCLYRSPSKQSEQM